MNDYGTPRPEAGIARRISRLEATRWPDVMIWKPSGSISGLWEAAGPGWEVIEEDPVKFADELEKRLRTPDVTAPRSGAALAKEENQ